MVPLQPATFSPQPQPNPVPAPQPQPAPAPQPGRRLFIQYCHFKPVGYSFVYSLKWAITNLGRKYTIESPAQKVTYYLVFF